MTKLIQKAMEMQERNASKANQVDKYSIQVIEPPKVALQLPYWEEEMRGTPRAFGRTNIFSTCSDANREKLLRGKIDSQKDYTVTLSGETFNQYDLNVWLAIVHLLRFIPLGQEVRLNTNQILVKMNIAANARNYHALEMSIFRLRANLLAINFKRKRKRGNKMVDVDITFYHSLIDMDYREFDEKRDKTTYKIALSPKILALFGNGDWFELHERIFITLKSKPLARQIACMYLTHDKPYKISVKNLQVQLGQEGIETKYFKRKLILALKDIAGLDEIESAEIDKKTKLVLVTVAKRPKRLKLTEQLA